MRSKHLLMILLLVVFTPWAAKAQSSLCDPEDQLTITYELSDSNGDGWNGGQITVTDVTTESTLLDTWTISDGPLVSGALAVCIGHEIQFSYTQGSPADENSWVIYDVTGSLIWSGSGSEGDQSYTYTVVCPPCYTPTDLTPTLTTGEGTIATLNWTAGNQIPLLSQFILPLSEVADVAGGTIRRMTFYSSNASADWGTAEFDVYVKAVEATAFASSNAEGLEDWASSSKIYVPQDGKDYAVVNAEAQDEMPLNFKAEKNGTYTLSFSHENVTFSYLHLIDNMTGTDVDLLATPSYSFDARNTDYASRFKLVFSTNDNNNDNEYFAFISNGNIIVNGEGTLQIIDVLGRIVMSKQLSTLSSQLSTLNYTPGVYLLRLINGNDVKVQKIVVR